MQSTVDYITSNLQIGQSVLRKALDLVLYLDEISYRYIPFANISPYPFTQHPIITPPLLQLL